MKTKIKSIKQKSLIYLYSSWISLLGLVTEYLSLQEAAGQVISCVKKRYIFVINACKNTEESHRVELNLNAVELSTSDCTKQKRTAMFQLSAENIFITSATKQIMSCISSCFGHLVQLVSMTVVMETGSKLACR